ncbi:MAG: IS3 family transposase [Candidatus Aenigmarchaeota archaeon]|nr:IS3 family transposase [Candidatus Aenigmarchaeota archaeon]
MQENQKSNGACSGASGGRAARAERCQMIRDSTLPARQACDALDVKRSSYYAWCGRTPRPDHNRSLRGEIHEVALEYPGYGYRRITAELHRRGNTANHKRVLGIMRDEHLLCKRKTFKPHTTNSRHNQPLYPNLTKNITVTRPNQVWVADITYIGLALGFVYLATILDLFSRKVIGWALSRRIDAQFCLEALNSAIRERASLGLQGLIHHSDRGVQYAARTYIERLLSIGCCVA